MTPEDIELLTRLSRLVAEGVLTPEEFQAQKQLVLNTNETRQTLGKVLDEISEESPGSSIDSALAYRNSLNPQETRFRLLTESDLRVRFTRADADELINFKMLVDAGLADPNDWELAKARVIRDRSVTSSVFKQDSRLSRRNIDVKDALSNSKALGVVGLILGIFGIVAGVIVATQNVGIGIGLAVNSAVFGLILVALGSYMEARLLQSEESLRRR
jgi:hypothetical protein